MGLRAAIGRLAVRHAHVLVVETPGGWSIRSGVEREVLTRGWSLAVSPADADILVICGEPGEGLAGAVEQVWQQLPGPRVRTLVTSRHVVADCLDTAGTALLDGDLHQQDARERPLAKDLLQTHTEDDMGDDHDMGMDHDMDGGMEMAPDGISLAEGAPDRDGLQMDVLHLPLGPVLPHWPAGLVLHCTLQGDVIVEADAEVLDGGEADVVRDFSVSAARMMDHVASVVALAGWQDAAAVARRLRDELLEGRMEGAERRVTALRARLARSVSLRWSLRGLCPVTAEQQQRDGLPLHVVGDTHDRLLTMLQWAANALAGGDHRDETSLCPMQVSSLVTGLDLAAARLVVASFGLDGLTSRQESHAE